MKTYRITFEYVVAVVADDEQTAEQLAWLEVDALERRRTLVSSLAVVWRDVEEDEAWA